MSAHRNVWLAPVHVFRHPRADAERRAQELLVSLGVGDRALAMPHELSGGEAQRVRDCACARHRAAGAADGRADGLASIQLAAETWRRRFASWRPTGEPS